MSDSPRSEMEKKVAEERRREYRELVTRSEQYIRQAMTGHTCGGPHPLAFSSDCIGCCPDTEQHYRAAAEMVIAWAQQSARLELEKMKGEREKELREAFDEGWECCFDYRMWHDGKTEGPPNPPNQTDAFAAFLSHRKEGK